MPYQPRVQNRAGDIYAEGITQAGKYQAQGIYDSANSIARGIKSAGVDLATGLEKAGDLCLSSHQDDRVGLFERAGNT
jgi:hypothetical protein